MTKKNPALIAAEETVNQIAYDLNSAEAEVGIPHFMLFTFYKAHTLLH